MFLPGTSRKPEGRPLSPQLALRVALLGMVALGAFAVLIFRLWALQVLASPKYQKAAQQNQERTVAIRAPRGSIFDRHGAILVENRPSLEVQLDPSVLRKPETRLVVLRRLGKVVPLRVAKLRPEMEDAIRQQPYEPYTVARDVERSVAFYLAENARRYPGLRVVPAPTRYYPNHRLAAHIFGPLGEVDRQELRKERYKRSYEPGDVIGKGGVEATYDLYLRGKDGKRRVPVDNEGQAQGVAVDRPAAVAGYDLRLTVDLRLQRAAEAALQAGIQRAAFRGADRGAIVVLDPRDGAVRAMASYPDFDPNWLISNSDRYKVQRARVYRNTDNPSLFDNAITGTWPAGSTFKPFTAVAAIKEGRVGPDDAVPCVGSVTLGADQRVFRNWDRNVHDFIALPQALARSCNTYFYELGYRLYLLGRDRGHPIQQWAKQFSFGRRTGIDIAGEARGLLPDPEWKLKEFKGTQDQEWGPGDSANLSIGQGFLGVTPLQLATAYAAIANGGYAVTPHIGESVERDGEVVVDVSRHARRKLDVSPYVIGALREGLYEVTHGPNGTAESIFREFPVDVAGKTGTAERAGEENVSLFASYAPAEKPELVVVVIIPKGGHGGETAAPTALDFYGRAFGYETPDLGAFIDTDPSN